MVSKPRDYSVLDKFDFERKPVGVKYLITRPAGIKRLEKELNFCEMLKEAQEGNVFLRGARGLGLRGRGTDDTGHERPGAAARQRDIRRGRGAF